MRAFKVLLSVTWAVTQEESTRAAVGDSPPCADRRLRQSLGDFVGNGTGATARGLEFLPFQQTRTGCAGSG